uniref:Major facilitator superfamily (MFS) profile domain-containing protein n=1 Tax=Bracon brevicornis TaxID=1563983 RepID=A0A6V7J169_9HYME
MMYIVMIVDATKTSINKHVASIIFASVQLLGCFLLSWTVDKIGRRPLLLISSSGMATSYAILGIFFTIQHLGYDVTALGWLPIAAVALYAFSYGTGVGPLTTVVANEVFNPDLATLCNSIHYIVFGSLSFILTKVFPLLTIKMGFQNCFFIFVATCTMGFFIILCFIPETKGKSIASIREELQGVKKGADSMTGRAV